MYVCIYMYRYRYRYRYRYVCILMPVCCVFTAPVLIELCSRDTATWSFCNCGFRSKQARSEQQEPVPMAFV